MLPKIEQPYYNTELPMSKTTVRYRPYLMKEQKIILIATAGDENDDVIGAIQQIIFNCTDGAIDAKKLNAIDIGFLMAKIRAASEGNAVDVNMRCKNIIDGKECGHLTPMEVDLSNMELSGEYDDELSKISVIGDIYMKLKVPSIEFFDFLDGDRDDIIKVLPLLIDYIYEGNGAIYKLDNESQEEADEFFNSLSIQNINDITLFLDSIPKLTVKIPFTCESCKNSEVISVEDIESFLD